MPSRFCWLCYLPGRYDIQTSRLVPRQVESVKRKTVTYEWPVRRLDVTVLEPRPSFLRSAYVCGDDAARLSDPAFALAFSSMHSIARNVAG